MPSEVVMYQAMFVLGILTFGAFAMTFNGYANLARDITIDNNLEQVVQEVGEQVIDLIKKSRQNFRDSENVSTTIFLQLHAEYANTPYLLIVQESSNGITELVAVEKIGDDPLAKSSLGFAFGDGSNGEIDFSGQINSGDKNPKVTYEFLQSTGLETVTLS